MTMEQLVQQLRAEGWHIWNLGERTTGGWTCRLYCRFAPAAGQRGATSYDRTEAFRYGEGATMLRAVMEAAREIIQPQEEEPLDLAAMLR